MLHREEPRSSSTTSCCMQHYKACGTVQQHATHSLLLIQLPCKACTSSARWWRAKELPSTSMLHHFLHSLLLLNASRTYQKTSPPAEQTCDRRRFSLPTKAKSTAGQNVGPPKCSMPLSQELSLPPPSPPAFPPQPPPQRHLHGRTSVAPETSRTTEQVGKEASPREVFRS